MDVIKQSSSSKIFLRFRKHDFIQMRYTRELYNERYNERYSPARRFKMAIDLHARAVFIKYENHSHQSEETQTAQ